MCPTSSGRRNAHWCTWCGFFSNDVPSRLEYRFTCCLIRSLVSTAFVRVVRVMRTAVMGPGTANDTTGEMAPQTMDQTNSSSSNKRPRTAQLLDNAPEY